jgi:hypothetical protein
MASDLRERVERALNLHEHNTRYGDAAYACQCGLWAILPPYNAVNAKALHERHRADAVLAVFAAWLREQADDYGGSYEWSGAVLALEALADEIERREASDE